MTYGADEIETHYVPGEVVYAGPTLSLGIGDRVLKPEQTSFIPLDVVTYLEQICGPDDATARVQTASFMLTTILDLLVHNHSQWLDDYIAHSWNLGQIYSWASTLGIPLSASTNRRQGLIDALTPDIRLDSSNPFVPYLTSNFPFQANLVCYLLDGITPFPPDGPEDVLGLNFPGTNRDFSLPR